MSPAMCQQACAAAEAACRTLGGRSGLARPRGHARSRRVVGDLRIELRRGSRLTDRRIGGDFRRGRDGLGLWRRRLCRLGGHRGRCRIIGGGAGLGGSVLVAAAAGRQEQNGPEGGQHADDETQQEQAKRIATTLAHLNGPPSTPT
ncbi:hypothetical protein CC_1513 [Caulobacter vibrioides CB15]|uniref:Uncharacterized protein n=1 Tax=Caulobacter vibrioides (strain ATCC 19089 / CIP 103742 / CB 15) TaxID=190650 RepID=Q9A851_CAUVC|nr:hypothetical protein CC_1513 [Caulobacter vibrioides CB15]